jgi:hypothetical protein
MWCVCVCVSVCVCLCVCAFVCVGTDGAPNVLEINIIHFHGDFLYPLAGHGGPCITSETGLIHLHHANLWVVTPARFRVWGLGFRV